MKKFMIGAALVAMISVVGTGFTSIYAGPCGSCSPCEKRSCRTGCGCERAPRDTSCEDERRDRNNETKRIYNDCVRARNEGRQNGGRVVVRD